MVQRRGRARFLLEALQPFGVGRQAGGQDLDRYLASEPRVARAIDLPHPAGAERGDDFVGAEASARLQGQRSRFWDYTRQACIGSPQPPQAGVISLRSGQPEVPDYDEMEMLGG